MLDTLKFGYSLNFSGLVNLNSMIFDNCKKKIKKKNNKKIKKKKKLVHLN